MCAWALQPKSWVMSRDVHGKLCCLLLGQALFFLINLFDLEANYSTILWWFCHTLTWISHGCTGVPILNPLPPLSPPYPSGSSQYTSPEHPVSCIKPGLMICFTYDNIHVSVYSNRSSHPHLLPQSPKECSMYLCLFCFLAYGIIITMFLNSIYMG